MRDIINTIHYFNQNKVAIHFISQGLATLDLSGKENSLSKMMISILSTVVEMERTQIRERQLEGIRLAKLKGGIYKGRVTGSKESVLDFLSKTVNKEALVLLRKGYKEKEVATLTELHPNTITKIKKLGLSKV